MNINVSHGAVLRHMQNLNGVAECSSEYLLFFVKICSGLRSTQSNYGVIVAGHSSSVATASQITKTEAYRDPDSFADIVRGMHLYGRKILRPEAVVNAKYNVA